MMRFWILCAKYQAIAHALRAHQGNHHRAATMLGITRTYLILLLR